MDAGSLDKLYGTGIAEPVISRIAESVRRSRIVMIDFNADDSGPEIPQGRTLRHASRYALFRFAVQ
jgi:hypothetical protein